MEENTRFLMQLANFLAQQNPSQTAAAANVSNGSTGGAPAINSYSTNNAVAEITKILINTASNLIPQMQASAAPSQQPSQQQQQQPQSIPPPSQQPHQQTTSSSQSLPPPPPSSQQQQHQQLQNSQQSEPSLSHQTQLDNSEQKPLQQLQQQQQQQQSHIASQQQISQSSSQIQSKQHQQHQPEHQQTQVHHQHQQQQIRHQQEQQPQQQTQIHHHQQQQNQHHHQQQQNQHHHQQQNQHHHQQQNQHHQQQQQNQHHQQQQQNHHQQQQQNQHHQQQQQNHHQQQQQNQHHQQQQQNHHQQQQQSQHHHQQQQQRNQHHHQHHQQHHQQNQQQQNNHHHQQQQQQQQPLENPQQQLERLQQQLQQLQQLHSSNQQLEQTIQISQQHKDNSSLSITPISHSNSEALNTNVSLPQGPATTCMSSPTYSMSNLNDMQFDGPAAKHAMGEKGGAFSLPYMLQKRLRLPREKMKRGPKEKEFFRCFLFCLPDMYAKMPKFTSSDPLEQEIVRSYQSQGYGFPGQDFIGGVPKKTYLCLKQKEERFLQYLISIYPVLENKRFELYRVDRQRNLIQLSDRTPRAIKDTKYQGTIIIIPFTRSSYLEAEQPVNVNSEIRFGQGNSNSPPLEIVQTVGNASFTSTDDEQSFGEMSASRMSLEEGILTNDSSPYQRSLEESFQKNNLDFNRLDLFTRLINARNQLTNVRDIKMPPKLFLVDQLFPLYQNDEDICNCCLNLTSVEETEPGDNTASLQAKKMFCNFWKKVLHKHFSGSFEKYPVVCPENGGDFFNVLGKILSHGFLLYGYWPVRFAKASACFVITEIQNEDSLLKSFKNTLSDFELCVVNAALKEARMLPPKFSVDLEGRLVTVLEKYGILNVPAPCDLGDTLQRIAQTILIQRPYWALKQLADGCKKSISCSFIGEMSEHDVEYLYLSLVPEPSVLIRKIEYKHCDVTEEAFYVLEKKVRQQFEMYLWSVNREQLEVIVECWGGCDCLIAPKYYVQFSLPESGCGAVFNCQQSLLTLSKRLVNKTDIADALKNAIELENTDWN